MPSIMPTLKGYVYFAFRFQNTCFVVQVARQMQLYRGIIPLFYTKVLYTSTRYNQLPTSLNVMTYFRLNFLKMKLWEEHLEYAQSLCYVLHVHRDILACFLN